MMMMILLKLKIFFKDKQIIVCKKKKKKSTLICGLKFLHYRMHAVGLHSALAIKRQRKRRDEQQRAKERRYSSQSGESGLTSPRISTTSLDQNVRRHYRNYSHEIRRSVDSQISGVLHIGIVFLVLGVFLLLSGFLQNDLVSWRNFKWKKIWNELLAIGLFFLCFGIFLLIINRIMTKKEEKDLEKYVQCQLTRSKSGHRLEVDSETGGLTTKHAKRIKSLQSKEVSTNISNETNVETKSMINSPTIDSSMYLNSKDASVEQSNMFLEKIIEEELTNEPSYIDISGVVPMKNKKNKKIIYDSCDPYEIRTPNTLNVEFSET